MKMKTQEKKTTWTTRNNEELATIDLYKSSTPFHFISSPPEQQQHH